MTFPWMLDKTSFDPLLNNAENLADSKKTGFELSAVNQKLLFPMADGSLPMVPVLCTAYGMLVNEDLFKKEKIDIPQNWAQLIDVCKKFKDLDLNVAQLIPNISAHIIKLDTLTGYSNRPKINNPDEYTVSYTEIDIFSSLNELLGKQDQVRVTRSYTNPMNGVQSIAFCDLLELRVDDASGRDSSTTENAVLMRVIPIDVLESKWVFPSEKYSDAQISIIDREGNYIIKGKSFKWAFDFLVL